MKNEGSNSRTVRTQPSAIPQRSGEWLSTRPPRIMPAKKEAIATGTVLPNAGERSSQWPMPALATAQITRPNIVAEARRARFRKVRVPPLVPPTKIICECLQVADLTPPPPAVPDPKRPLRVAMPIPPEPPTEQATAGDDQSQDEFEDDLASDEHHRQYSPSNTG